jgi:hypothetical protein
MKTLFFLLALISSTSFFQNSTKSNGFQVGHSDSIRAITKKKFEELKENFSYEYDEFTKNERYTNLQFETHYYKNATSIQCFVTGRGEMVLISQYASFKWIFHDHISVLINDTVFKSSNINTQGGKSFRDTKGGGVVERNKYFMPNDLQLIEKIVKAGPKAKIKIRFQGEDYFHDIKLKENCYYAFKASYKLSGYLRILN